MLEQSGSGQVPVDFAGVKEIFPLPETNDSLHVTMKDGSCREGVVSAVTDTMFVLIGEGVAMIPFADMQEIRYCGKVVRVREPGSRGKTDTWKIAVGSRDAEDGFWCRVPEHSGITHHIIICQFPCQPDIRHIRKHDLPALYSDRLRHNILQDSLCPAVIFQRHFDPV